MAIQDSNPERRNLVVTALAFILYYAGGGTLSDYAVRVTVVNLTFARPDVLAAAAWAMLIWFGLRYWQSSRYKFWSELVQEIRMRPSPEHRPSLK